MCFIKHLNVDKRVQRLECCNKMQQQTQELMVSISGFRGAGLLRCGRASYQGQFFGKTWFGRGNLHWLAHMVFAWTCRCLSSASTFPSLFFYWTFKLYHTSPYCRWWLGSLGIYWSHHLGLWLFYSQFVNLDEPFSFIHKLCCWKSCRSSSDHRILGLTVVWMVLQESNTGFLPVWLCLSCQAPCDVQKRLLVNM